jgi:dUTP pyrophosphatase
VVRTGVAVAIDAGHVGLVAPRSGLASDHGVTVLNAPGVIDSGYRGEIMVVLANLDPATDYGITRGDRIAQLLILPVCALELEEVPSLPPTPRGASGLGGSGP